MAQCNRKTCTYMDDQRLSLRTVSADLSQAFYYGLICHDNLVDIRIHGRCSREPKIKYSNVWS